MALLDWVVVGAVDDGTEHAVVTQTRASQPNRINHRRADVWLVWCPRARK
jgi:hypothetical protein